ncbi:HNH endonuclease signature motif containing protein, partial [Arthrobacter sp. H5]|uniref:HNH endonuclease signature motif containing protein n=1 Tax=Arthrobacter sp. H5 TaxID=1267973 RepID=UPI000484BE52
KDWTRILNPTCTHPGCNVAASACEIDHTVEWAAGGHTALWNTHPDCNRHHMYKTEGFWGGEQPEPGTFTTTSLAGKTYTTLPEPLPPF